MRKDYKLTFYNNGHFFVKNTMIFLCLFLILIILSGIAVFNNFMNESDRKMVANTKSDVVNLRTISDETFIQIENQIRGLATDSRILQMIANTPINELMFSRYEDVTSSIHNYFGGIQNVENIYLHSRFREYVYGKDGTTRIRDFGNEDIIEACEKLEKNEFKMYCREPEAGNRYFTFLYKIAESEKASGSIIVNIDLEDYIHFYKTGGMSVLAETDSNNVIYSADYRMPPELATSIISRKNGIVEQDSEFYIMVREPSAYGGFDFVIIEPIPDYRANRLKLYISFTFVIIALAIFFAAVAFYLSKMTYKPISELAELVDNPFSEKSKKYLENDVNTKKIADRLFLIVSNNETLKDELNTKMENLNYAQLKALQWQINPHFIFNTLNMLYYSSEETGRGNGVSKGIMSLSKLMRYCLKTEPMIVDVKTEIEYAEEYIKIMEARLGDEFSVNWDIADNFLNNQMVKMTVQPILENCFRYGLKNIDYKGIINISAAVEDNIFEIVISDNGVGMEDEKIAETNAYLKASPAIVENHIGLANVNNRIVLTYGESYGAKVSKSESGGVSVSIKFPNIKQNY